MKSIYLYALAVSVLYIYADNTVNKKIKALMVIKSSLEKLKYVPDLKYMPNNAKSIINDQGSDEQLYYVPRDIARILNLKGEFFRLDEIKSSIEKLTFIDDILKNKLKNYLESVSKGSFLVRHLSFRTCLCNPGSHAVSGQCCPNSPYNFNVIFNNFQCGITFGTLGGNYPIAQPCNPQPTAVPVAS